MVWEVQPNETSRAIVSGLSLFAGSLVETVRMAPELAQLMCRQMIKVGAHQV